MISIESSGSTRSAIQSIIDQDVRVQRGLRRGLMNAGKMLKKNMQQEILRGVKTGRVYRIRRGNRVKNHRASAAGETAANISGTYRKSVGFQAHGYDELEFGASADYAKYLEEGTSRMAERPGLRNTIEAHTGDIEKMLEEAVFKAISP